MPISRRDLFKTLGAAGLLTVLRVNAQPPPVDVVGSPLPTQPPRGHRCGGVTLELISAEDPSRKFFGHLYEITPKVHRDEVYSSRTGDTIHLYDQAEIGLGLYPHEGEDLQGLWGLMYDTKLHAVINWSDKNTKFHFDCIMMELYNSFGVSGHSVQLQMAVIGDIELRT